MITIESTFLKHSYLTLYVQLEPDLLDRIFFTSYTQTIVKTSVITICRLRILVFCEVVISCVLVDPLFILFFLSSGYKR